MGIVKERMFGMVTPGGEWNPDRHEYEQEWYIATLVPYCVLYLVSCVIELTSGTWVKEGVRRGAVS